MPKLRRTFKNIEKDLGNIKQIKGKDVDEFVFALKAEGHTHVHFSDKVRATPVVLSIIKESGIRVDPPEGKKIERIATKDRKIIFSHRRALGDALMFSAGIRDFKLLFPDIKINVDSNQPSIWVNNPYLDTSLKKEDPGVEFYRVGYPAVGNANNTAIHFTTMFLLDMIAITDLHSKLPISLGEFAAAFSNGSVGDPSLGKPEKNPEAREPFISLRKQYKNICENFVRQRGDIHLTEEEKEHNLIKDLYGVDKYWVIAPGGKRDCTSKIWDWRGFQEVIDYFEGRIKFVVIGKSDLLVEKLNNVIDLTDKFNSDVRGIFSLVYNAEGCVAGPSFLMHLAAAMPPRFKKERKPCVSIFGGREPSAWSWYCNQQILHTNGVFSCCDNGGCWTARTHPMQKDPKHNRNLCRNTVKIDDRTVQACMEAITPTDVIMAIDKYYSGDLYKLEKIPVQKPIQVKNAIENIQVSGGKEINLLGNLNSSGGGEQSLVTIAGMLRKDGWKVNLYPWSTVNDRFRDVEVMPRSFKDGLGSSIVPGVPLLFYANDCVWDFVKEGQDVVDRSSSVIVGINYANGSLPKAEWLAKSGKLKAVIFQNEEKKQEFIRDEIGFNGTKKIVLYGAVDLQSFYEICPPQRNGGELVVLKHCKPDYRKYVTEESVKSGDKIHVWQKKVGKDVDTKFYKRLLKDTKGTRFEFMEAHKELVNAFKDEPRMVFHKWDSIPVDKFLSRGHVYLYRTSNAWRDQYPRVMAEALLSGLPVLTEPRDGTKDRVIHGDTGFYCIDYDGFLYALKLLQRKENYRHSMGMYAKDWAKQNLDPHKWVDIVNELSCS